MQALVKELKDRAEKIKLGKQVSHYHPGFLYVSVKELLTG